MRKNQNGDGYSCTSCYCNFGTGKKDKEAADTKESRISQFFSKAGMCGFWVTCATGGANAFRGG